MNLLCHSIKKIENLSQLDLQLPENKIGVEGAKTISRTISGIRNLTTLNLIIHDKKDEIGFAGLKAIGRAMIEPLFMTSLSFDFGSCQSNTPL